VIPSNPRARPWPFSKRRPARPAIRSTAARWSARHSGGLYGQKHIVKEAGGAEREVVVDDAYLVKAIQDPMGER